MSDHENRLLRLKHLRSDLETNEGRRDFIVGQIQNIDLALTELANHEVDALLDLERETAPNRLYSERRPAEIAVDLATIRQALSVTEQFKRQKKQELKVFEMNIGVLRRDIELNEFETKTEA